TEQGARVSKVRTLFLMRHGEAAWTRPDSERELTERGREQTRAVVAAMGSRLAHLDALYSSPYRRARQTLAEVEQLTGFQATACYDFLVPDEPPQRALEALEPHIRDHTLIVAHQPLLGSLVSLLTE